MSIHHYFGRPFGLWSLYGGWMWRTKLCPSMMRTLSSLIPVPRVSLTLSQWHLLWAGISWHLISRNYFPWSWSRFVSNVMKASRHRDQGLSSSWSVIMAFVRESGLRNMHCYDAGSQRENLLLLSLSRKLFSLSLSQLLEKAQKAWASTFKIWDLSLSLNLSEPKFKP